MEDNKPKLARLRYRFLGIMVESILTEAIVIPMILGILVVLKVTNSLSIILIFSVLYYVGILTLDFLNNVVLVKLTNGKSLGKALFNTRILGSNFRSASLWSIIKHWFVLTGFGLSLSWVGLLVNYLVMRKMPLKQGIHNIIADTVVVESQTSNNKFVLLWGSVALAFMMSLVLCIMFGVILTTNNYVDLADIFRVYSEI
jgi:uncharacterized RDD family membrane protein YckC